MDGNIYKVIFASCFIWLWNMVI